MFILLVKVQQMSDESMLVNFYYAATQTEKKLEMKSTFPKLSEKFN